MDSVKACRNVDKHGDGKKFLIPAVILFFFNTVLVAPLFIADRLRYAISIEGAFIGLARFLSRHPDPFGWYPYWYGGTPVQFTYTPGLHYVNALLVRFPWLTPGQVFHATGALAYSLSAVTTAYMAYFFTGRKWWAFGSGMLASLWAPVIWFVRELRLNSGDF